MDENSKVNEPSVPYGQPLDFQQVWLMFQETNRRFQETDRKFQETDRILTEKFKETAEQSKETDKQIRELNKLFTSQWGKLVESLVDGDLVKLLRQKGIQVERTAQRVEGNHQGENFEYDIIAYNGTEIVIVEVKTTLRPDDVNDFHRKLWKSKTYLPEYKEKVIYGALAYITADGSSHRMAEKLGFFVIRAIGSSASIINKESFKPKAF